MAAQFPVRSTDDVTRAITFWTERLGERFEDDFGLCLSPQPRVER